MRCSWQRKLKLESRGLRASREKAQMVSADLLGSEVKRLQEQRGVASGRGASRQRCQTAPWFPGRARHSENGREEVAVVSPSPVLEVV